jgi:hypothetical protein
VTQVDPGTVWILLRRARTAVGTCVVWPRYTDADAWKRVDLRDLSILT